MSYYVTVFAVAQLEDLASAVTGTASYMSIIVLSIDPNPRSEQVENPADKTDERLQHIPAAVSNKIWACFSPFRMADERRRRRGAAVDDRKTARVNKNPACGAKVHLPLCPAKKIFDNPCQSTKTHSGRARNVCLHVCTTSSLKKKCSDNPFAIRTQERVVVWILSSRFISQWSFFKIYIYRLSTSILPFFCISFHRHPSATLPSNSAIFSSFPPTPSALFTIG